MSTVNAAEAAKYTGLPISQVADPLPLLAVADPSSFQLADPLHCYNSSVCGIAEELVGFLSQQFESERGFQAQSLREDFCGTALISMEWVKSHPARTAVGYDWDFDTLEWARVRHAFRVDRGLDPMLLEIGPEGLPEMRPELAERVQYVRSNLERLRLVCSDVRCITNEPVDLIVANNFSWLIFHEREELLTYFKAVCERGLSEEGCFSLDLYGGPGGERLEVEELGVFDFKPKGKMRPLRYTAWWEQAAFDPTTRRTLCHIHFTFHDGSRLEKAFTYDWTLWELHQVKALLYEAGFQRLRVFFDEEVDDDDDDDDDGDVSHDMSHEAYAEHPDDKPDYSQQDWFRAQICAFK